ncbi:deoxyribodipyrimidine photo-lyase [Pontibacillus sp. ALD_SL1]|uniref:FAD-binding domain-containing protein n=1 Tax=Pontibacillus sp. ALD_SL1 TaxID=2777185 RepID=UPI001A97232D|nr:FAD-binding domain-containing protein [Pontibacillus sp. ALD_SL1]QST00513.1 deoxyribodipyrimidine photo-lyase [Pontibacillus sp. ALD_SL1]
MLHVVWYKRDLRIHDHRPLQEAWREKEPILPLYVAEPSIWQESELSIRHFQFVKESLEDLQGAFKELGGSMFVTIAEMESVLNTIYESVGPFTLHAHEENGTPVTYERDKRVRQWMKDRGLLFHEYQHCGVVRGEKSEELFKKDWKEFIETPVMNAPNSILTLDQEILPSTITTNMDTLLRFKTGGSRIKYGQQGGEGLAHETLESFLDGRFTRYKEELANPLASTNTCSRLSPYLAFGNISMRQVVQKTKEAIEHCDKSDDRKQLKAFNSKLEEHCRSIQWIEDHPQFACNSGNPSFDPSREVWEEGFERWSRGETGLPIIDAAMRALIKTGWLNFRSRAMLLSFACHTLRMNWQEPAEYLAGLFVDYEPGIYYKQVHLVVSPESSKRVRLYDPVKEGKKNDPEGRFVRQYIPELKHVPDQYIHEPWKYDGFFHLDYYGPIVDVGRANRHVKTRMADIESSGEDSEKKEAAKEGDEQIVFDLFTE